MTTDSDADADRVLFDPPRTFVKSAVRTIEVLKFFYRIRRPARAAQVASELSLPISSTKYLLDSLAESGYLTVDKQRKTYFPSILLVGFASWLSGVYPDGETLRALAHDVHVQTGEIATISVLHDQNMRSFIIEHDPQTKPRSYDYRVRIPIFGSASGGAALATQPDELVNEILDSELMQLPPEGRTEFRDTVTQKIEQFRRQGYATNFGRTADRYRAIAIALPQFKNAPPMALGVYLSARQSDRTDEYFANLLNRSLQNHLPTPDAV